MQLNPKSATPLYIQIAEHLQQQIKAGIYQAGYKLPSERELAESLNVSRMTARQAIQQLIQHGVAHSQVGKGTFVATSKVSQELRELTSFSEEMHRRNLSPGSCVVSQKLRSATDEEANALQINTGQPIAVLKRIRLADNHPLALEVAHLNLQYCPNIFDQHDFAHESLYYVLNHVYEIHLVWANQSIAARLPNKEEQLLLQIGQYSPVLSQTRVTFDADDRPIEFVRSVYNGEHYQLRTTLQIRMEA